MSSTLIGYDDLQRRPSSQSLIGFGPESWAIMTPPLQGTGRGCVGGGQLGIGTCVALIAAHWPLDDMCSAVSYLIRRTEI